MPSSGDEAGTGRKYLYDLAGMHDYKGVLYLPIMPPELIERAANFDMSDGDILFGTYPRSGTPMLSELLWLIQNEADVTKARQTLHGVRVRFMEHVLKEGDPLEMLERLPHPRLLKTHLPASFYTKQLSSSSDIKIINMIRNPKDVLVSFYKFYISPYLYVNFPGTWDEFFEIFKADQLFGGTWYEHVTSWWALKDREDALVLRYEDVRERPGEAVRTTAAFLGKSLTEEQIRVIADYVINDVREESPMGGWRDYFTVAQSEWYDEKYAELLKKANLDFKYM